MISSTQLFILFLICSLILLSSNSSISFLILYVNIIVSFPETSLILLLICIFISDSIHNIKFDVYHALSAVNKAFNIKSYFLSIIIFTKKPAKIKSYFLAFFSSFHTFATLAQAFLEDSLYFSLVSLADSVEFHVHSDDSMSGV
ncbi:hypothetical protein HOF65_05220 [bacterium]|nr:hypothetical protein [bacterium]